MQTTIDAIKAYKLVAIARRISSDRIVDVAKALYKGGIRLLEVTFDQSDPDCLLETPKMIRLVKDALGDDLYVGAGTVLTKRQVKRAREAGADFCLAPDVNVEVIEKVKQLGMVSVPGALTPSEITQAYEAGADIVKVFPAGNFGTAYIKAVRGPISHIPLMAVGGVNLSNLKAFFEAGCMSAGIGGSLMDKNLISTGKWDELAALAARYVEEAK